MASLKAWLPAPTLPVENRQKTSRSEILTVAAAGGFYTINMYFNTLYKLYRSEIIPYYISTAGCVENAISIQYCGSIIDTLQYK